MPSPLNRFIISFSKLQKTTRLELENLLIITDYFFNNAARISHSAGSRRAACVHCEAANISEWNHGFHLEILAR